ncbi:MAG: hypothetical protein ACTSXP_10105 [Promethearchaeota archaeon]
MTNPAANIDPENEVFYKDRWEYIGYHRVLGSFMFNVVFFIFAVGYVMILPLFIPYPESMGFYNILTGIFSSIFTFADLGTASALSRFVAEYRVKNPIKAIQYIRFFIWFQAFTGLAQTTIVSLVGLFALGGSNLSYMPWLFVWLSIIQYPGWLGVFSEALKGMQHLGKVAIVGLLNTIIFQILTLVICAQLGAYLGNKDPHMGGVMGASIGLVIGYYIDDFSSVMISGYMFSKVIEPMGFRIRDVFVPQFDKEIAIESIKFGSGVMLFVLSFQSVGTIVAFIYANYLPNYSTYLGSFTILGPIIGLAETVNGIHTGNHRSAVSEAYFNQKKNYSVYILSNAFRTVGMITFMVVPITIVLGPAIIKAFFPSYLDIFNQIFIPVLVLRCIFQHSHLMNEVLIGTAHHKFNVLITVLEQIVSLTLVILCIYFQFGIYTLIIPTYFQTAVKQGIGWTYINKRIINLRWNAWQNWIATAMAGTCYFAVLYCLNTLFEMYLFNIITDVGSIIILILISIYILPGPGYFLLLGLFGGFDDNTLEDFRRGYHLSGPSKPIIRIWLKFLEIGASVSPLHGRFPMYYKNVGKEIEELMLMKKKADMKLINKK